jgi:hypothetical protein
MTNVIVIVDPDYGDGVERAARSAPVWVVASQTNRNACGKLWESHPHSDHRDIGATTVFETAHSEDRLGSLLSIAPDLETHHGEVRDDELVFPEGFVLEVIGLALAYNVTNALRELGFTAFVQTPEGFQARK